jgi:putative aldouronate transport system permease protein
MVSTRSKGEKVFEVFNIIFMCLLGFATLYPFWYILVASFNVGRDFARGGVYFWPRAFTLENYEVAIEDPRIFASLTISVGRTAIGTVLSVLGTALISYAVIVDKVPGRTAFTFFFYFTTLIGGGMIPYYMLLRSLGLTRSFWLYVIPGIYSFFNFVLMRTYFKTVPLEMMESAQMDGAGHATILFRIYFPLALPVIATIALFVGVGHWNDWFTGAYYQSRENLWPAATVLQRMLRESIVNYSGLEGRESQALMEELAMRSWTPQALQMAFVMLLTMPIVFVYPFLQKYYVRGVMIGAVKG